VRSKWLGLSLCIVACGVDHERAPEMEPEMPEPGEDVVFPGDTGDGANEEDEVPAPVEETPVIEAPATEVPPLSRGEVNAPWSDFCVATFERDYVLRDWSDAPLFTAKAGQSYLLGSWHSGSFELLVPTGGGVLGFDADLPFDEDQDVFPFASNCELGQTKMHVAVFSDVTLYADEALSTPICTLKRGTQFAFPSWGQGGVDSALPIGRIDVEGWPAPCAGYIDAYFSQPGDQYPIYQVRKSDAD
jgi:hypothetical protein